MPGAVAAAIVGAVAGVGTSAAAAAAVGTGLWLATTALTMAISVGMAYAIGQLFRPPTPEFTTQAVQQTIKDAMATRNAIYGEARVSGAVLFHGVTKQDIPGSTNAPSRTVEYIHLVIGLATHECDAIGDVYFNDKLSTHTLFGDLNIYGTIIPSVRITKHLGTGAQTVDPDLMAAFPDLITANHTFSGIAYLYVKLGWAEPPAPGYGGWTPGSKMWGRVPDVRAVVRGRKVHDPRNAAYPNDVPVWSDNWALCVLDYLRDRKFGASRSHDISDKIDLPMAIAAANASDEQVDIALPWSGATAYLTNDRVAYNGFLYTALTNNTNITPPLDVFWKATTLPPWSTNVGVWSAAVTYGPGSIVSHAGQYYKSLQINMNKTPGQPQSATFWELQVGFQGNVLNHAAWAAGTSYIAGNLVTQNSGAVYTVYEALKPSLGQDPNVTATVSNTWRQVRAVVSPQPRYTCNGVVETSRTPSDIIASMRGAGAGNVVFADGKYKIEAGGYTPGAYIIDEDDLRGNMTVRARSSRKSLFNAVKAVFVDPGQDYQAVEAPLVFNPWYQAQDAGFDSVPLPWAAGTTYAAGATARNASAAAVDTVVWVSLVDGNIGNTPAEGAFWHEIKPIIREIQLPFVNDIAAAQRIAKIHLERGRQSIVVDIAAKYTVFGLSALDAVNLDIERLDWTGGLAKAMKVAKWTLNTDGGIDLTLHEEAAASYVWNYGDWTLYDPNPDFRDTTAPADVTNLTVTETMQLAGATTSIVDVTWAAPADPKYVAANVYYRLLGTTNWILGAAGVGAVTVSTLITGDTYEVKVNSVSTQGVESTTGPIAAITLDGGTFAAISPPVNPTLGIQYDALGNVTAARLQFDWDMTSTPIPDGGIVFWQVLPNKNSMTLATDNGTSADLASVDLLDFWPKLVQVTGGTAQDVTIAANPIPAIPGLIGHWWMRLTDGVNPKSEWRKGGFITPPSTIHLTAPLNVAPTAGDWIDVAVIAWVDDRIDPTHKLLYCNGEVFSWGGIAEGPGSTFSLTGLQRGLEGTSQTNLAGQEVFYYPAAGGNTHMRVIPRGEAVINGTTVTWNGTVTGLQIAAGSWGSVTLVLYKAIQNGGFVRSYVVPLSVVAY